MLELYQIIFILCNGFVSTLSFRYNYVDPRIYSFAFTGIKPGSFFDGEKLTGTSVELMKEVCCRASKRCAAALVPFNQCMTADILSPVLDNRYHDGCITVAKRPRNSATFAFSDITLLELGPPTIIVRSDSNITLEDLRDPRNNIKVVFPNEPEPSLGSSAKRFLEEFFVRPENIITITIPQPSEGIEEVLRLVNDPCAALAIVGLVGLELVDPNASFKVLKSLGEPLGKPTLMVRKDGQDILDWWDYTLKRFMCSPDYAKFCKRMDDQFGPNPINCPDPSQVDCSDCTRPHHVPGCDCKAD